MNNPTRHSLRNRITALCGAAALLLCGLALADPPSRVARLTQIGGTVSFSPAGEEDWVLAQANRPLVTGDRVWADAGSRAELQIGSAAARLGQNTSLALLNLDDRIVQLQVAQGTLNLRVRRVYGDQSFEIDTPNLAFSIRRAGDYRVDVDPSGNATMIRVRGGEAEAWGEGAAYVIGAGQQYTFRGEGLRDYTFDPLPPPDEFDRWCFDRDRREDAAVAARFVSPDVIGYSDLDEYGAWRSVEGYGNVWVPTAVAVDWAPYHYGHWAWVDPWGWTWIDDAPWGFAPFHYGRWAYLSSRWCWVPGPIAVRPVYAPALVAFVGGGGFRLALSVGGPVAGVAWFPLGPGEVYQPAYTVSRAYFTNINVSNTVVSNTYVTNVYNNVNVTNIVYRNREAPGAITAVPATAFASAEPIARHAVPVSRDVIAREPVTHVAAVAPSHASVIAAGAVVAGGAAAAMVAKPAAAVLQRRVVAKTAPPPPPPSFAAKASLLSAQPGKPLEADKVTRIRSERATEAPKVKLVAPSVTPQPLRKGPAAEGGQAVQEERFKERKGTPQGAPVPQPPASAQERMREYKGAPPETGKPPQPERIKEYKGAPPETGKPPQPERIKEYKGPPQTGQPPQERIKEYKGPAPQTGQPPQERVKEYKGPAPQTGQLPQERIKEYKGPAPQTGQPPQERVKEYKGPAPQTGQPPIKERKGPPPQGGQAPQQERVQKGPAPPPPPQAAHPEPKREEPKGKEQKDKEQKDKEQKDKDKEHRGQ